MLIAVATLTGFPALAMVAWILRRLLHRPRLSSWQGFLGLSIWMGMVVVGWLGLGVGMAGHTDASTGNLITGILLVQLTTCLWMVWYLYVRLGHRDPRVRGSD